MNPSIRVGVFDWNRFPAKDNFYPGDLPAAWRLSFYANEFECVCINVDAFMQNPDLLCEMIEELEQDIELSFYVQSTSLIQLVKDAAVAGSVNLAYLIYDSANSELSAYLHANRPFSRSAGVKVAPGIIASTELWRPNMNTIGPSGIALFPGIASMRQYRQWIEQWLPEAGDETELTLWLEGGTAGYQTLSECRSLVELMGY